jgi:hypothetical protein
MTAVGGYIVFEQIGEGKWKVVGEIDRRPGLPARRSRAQAVRDLIGREPRAGEAFSVLARSEWRNALDH